MASIPHDGYLNSTTISTKERVVTLYESKYNKEKFEVSEEEKLQYTNELNTFQLIDQFARCLLLDQPTIATSMIFCHRFYAVRRKALICGACLLIATKTCEVLRSLRDIINVLHAVMNKTTEVLGTGEDYTNLKDALINTEQTVLRVLGFNLEVELPYIYLLNYYHHFEKELMPSTLSLAMELVYDSFANAKLCLSYPANVRATVCLHLASLVNNEQLSSKAWWYQFDTSDDDIETISLLMFRMYKYV